MRAAWARVAGRRASSFWRTSADRPTSARVVEIGRNADALLFAEGDDVGLLSIDVGGIAGVNLELSRNTGLHASELGPDRPQALETDARKGQQLEGGAPAPVLVDVQAMTGGFVRRQRQAVQQAPAIGQSVGFGTECLLASGAPTQPSSSPIGVRRWSALSARRRSRYSAREVNMR